jgi:hypothetical protein
MTEEEATHLIHTDPDFVVARRFGNSLKRLEQRYEKEPDGCPDHVVAAVLLMTEEQVREAMDRVVVKLRDLMGIRMKNVLRGTRRG